MIKNFPKVCVVRWAVVSAICTILIGCASAEQDKSVSAAPPNVIIIMSDDQGIGDFGIHGNPIVQTPHIDEMARNSASLSRFYVNAVCSPTRASLMTGRWSYRTGVTDTFKGRSIMNSEETTIAEVLNAAGYRCGGVGKWSLGDAGTVGRATNQGFPLLGDLQGSKLAMEIWQIRWPLSSQGS